MKKFKKPTKTQLIWWGGVGVVGVVCGGLIIKAIIKNTSASTFNPPRTDLNVNTPSSLPSTPNNVIPANNNLNISYFPIKKNVYNYNVIALQVHLNKLSALKGLLSSPLSADGAMGDLTIGTIRTFFPSIARSIDATGVLSQSQYNDILAYNGGTTSSTITTKTGSLFDLAFK